MLTAEGAQRQVKAGNVEAVRPVGVSYGIHNKRRVHGALREGHFRLCRSVDLSTW